MAKSLEQLTTEIKNLTRALSGLQTQVVSLDSKVSAAVLASDLVTTEKNIEEQIAAVSNTVTKLEEKLARVVLPTDTRYYLDESDISDFRSNFAKLLAMTATFEQLYKNLVAYSAKVQST
jgi:prefoldin subunit 5